MTLAPVTYNRLAELLKKRKQDTVTIIENKISTITEVEKVVKSTGIHGESITLNKEQLDFCTLATKGNSCILVGAAGCGKTTCMKEVASALIMSGRLPIFQNVTHKYLPISGVPGIVFCAYTRRATANLRKALPDDLKNNCITIHKLLEYEPFYYEVSDPETGDSKTTMRFEPARNAYNPLPTAIHTIVIDESSMVSVELFNQIVEATSHEIQFIFLGDIQQLPPVFGSAILGFKMLELPTVELTQVYRQALESPIIRLAHRILSGVTIPMDEFSRWHYPGQLKLHPWKKKLHQEIACLTFSKFMTTTLDHGEFNPETDVILIPFNKSFGTDEVNKHIANHIARKEGKDTYEIIAGFNKLYFSVGDKVLYDKEDAIIVSIARNNTYTGKQPQPHSTSLDYWGHNPDLKAHSEEMSDEAVDFLMSQAASLDADEDRVQKCSHILTLRRLDSDFEITVESASALNTLTLGYAITTHKAQGSEWRKVFIASHQSHATMLSREWWYTAVTRAKEELYIICEPEAFIKGISNQRIVGNTLAEKAMYFRGKLDSGGRQ